MTQMSSYAKNLLGDRIQLMAVLIVACFVSVLLLRSQSGASYPTYALALLMVATFPRWRDVLELSLMRWIVALLLWLCLSVFWSEQFEWRAAISVWTRALLVFCFVVAFAECQLRGQLQRWMGVGLTLVGAIAVIAAIVNFYVTNPADGRLNGLGQLDTHVIAALVYGVILIFVLRTAQLYPSRALRVAAGLIVLAILVAVYLSDSRNAWISVVLGTGVFVFVNRSADPKQFLITAASMGLLLIVVLALMLLNETTREFLLPRGDSFRLAIWSAIANRIDGYSVLIGNGILTADDVTAGGIVFKHPHNMYLALVYQGGLLALFIYGVIVVKGFGSIMRNYENPGAKLALSILAIASSAYLLDGHELIDKVGDTWLLFWLPIGVAAGLGWRPRESGSSP